VVFEFGQSQTLHQDRLCSGFNYQLSLSVTLLINRRLFEKWHFVCFHANTDGYYHSEKVVQCAVHDHWGRVFGLPVNAIPLNEAGYQAHSMCRNVLKAKLLKTRRTAHRVCLLLFQQQPAARRSPEIPASAPSVPRSRSKQLLGKNTGHLFAHSFFARNAFVR
jgi:hypothetical protein